MTRKFICQYVDPVSKEAAAHTVTVPADTELRLLFDRQDVTVQIFLSHADGPQVARTLRLHTPHQFTRKDEPTHGYEVRVSSADAGLEKHIATLCFTSGDFSEFLTGMPVSCCIFTEEHHCLGLLTPVP